MAACLAAVTELRAVAETKCVHAQTHARSRQCNVCDSSAAPYQPSAHVDDEFVSPSLAPKVGHVLVPMLPVTTSVPTSLAPKVGHVLPVPTSVSTSCGTSLYPIHVGAVRTVLRKMTWLVSSITLSSRVFIHGHGAGTRGSYIP
ncbi:hypothetical protein PMIN02_007528 [Paraphaeosphaeria minitans]